MKLMVKLRFVVLVTSLTFLLVPAQQAAADHGGPHEGTTPTSRLNAALRLSLEEGEKTPTFQLMNQEGRLIALDALKGDPVFLSFTYTNCKKHCPRVLESRTLLEKKYETRLGKEIVFLFVTLDSLDNKRPGSAKASPASSEQQPKHLHLLTGTHLAVRNVLSNYKN